MSLESIERGLSLACTSETADADFSFMQTEVNKYSANVVQEVKRRLSLGSRAPDASAFSDLLSWEEAVLQWLQ